MRRFWKMKTKKKVLLLFLCAVLLVAVSIVGTLAYLTSRDEVTNTFTVGKVDITLDEADVDEYGKEIAGADRVKGNEYKLIPGHTYVKDPAVTVEGDSEESYVRMLVTINKLATLKAIFGSNFLPQNYVTGWDSSIWVPVATTDNGDDTITYEFRYCKTVSTVDGNAEALEPLFESFTLPGKVTGEQIAELEELEINVVAHAIQADGFDNADKAWAAFDEQMIPAQP